MEYISKKVAAYGQFVLVINKCMCDTSKARFFYEDIYENNT